MNKKEKRAQEIEALYYQAKNNEQGAMLALYNELQPIFSAYFISTMKKNGYEGEMYKKDLEQDFYLELERAVKMYEPGRTTSFLSFVFYFFKNLLVVNAKYHNEFHTRYYYLKGKRSEKIEMPKEIATTDNVFEISIFDSLSHLKEPDLTIIKLYYIEEMPFNEIAEYLFSNGMTKKKYSREWVSQNLKKNLKIFSEKLGKDFFSDYL